MGWGWQGGVRQGVPSWEGVEDTSKESPANHGGDGDGEQESVQKADLTNPCVL